MTEHKTPLERGARALAEHLYNQVAPRSAPAFDEQPTPSLLPLLEASFDYAGVVLKAAQSDEEAAETAILKMRLQFYINELESHRRYPGAKIASELSALMEGI